MKKKYYNHFFLSRKSAALHKSHIFFLISRPFRTVLGTVFVVAFDALSEQLVEKLGYSTTV